jgi:hypothetical protein
MTRRAVTQESAGDSHPAVNSVALRFVPSEDLQVKGYGAYRKLLNQAATTEGAKR